MTAANQQIRIDEEVLRAHVRSLEDAAETLRAAASAASGGVGASAFGALCGSLLGPAISSLGDASESALTTATALATGSSSGLKSTVDSFSDVEDKAVETFRAMEGTGR
ncbi:hypothetical protein [Microbacterium sp. 3J1]|uniref:hypothetical protein n=1 Tax=Microbacterium sp. 3J1 TaxID=861269 RepID=UPI000A4B0CC4|nr:hypothetical protein [Microbacterium sp. 3J1]